MTPEGAYRCVGCGKPFPAWAKLREHHTGCRKFIEWRRGFTATRESMGRSGRMDTRIRGAKRTNDEEAA